MAKRRRTARLLATGRRPMAITGRLQDLCEGELLVLSFAQIHRVDSQRILPIILQTS
jgi:hypothetical protein